MPDTSTAPIIDFEQALARLKPRYDSFALVTTREHVEALPADDDTVLIVSCDWLLWQQLMGAGRHCVHYELGITDWTEPSDVDVDLNLRANDWFYDGGADQTRFKGVSLGAYFNGDVGWCLISYHRMERALAKLIERFGPKRIRFFDYRNDINVLTIRQRRLLVRRMAEDRRIDFEDRSPDYPSDSSDITEKLGQPERRSWTNRLAIGLYARALELAALARTMFADRRKRVLILVNSYLTEAMVSNFAGGLSPIFYGRTVPRKASLLRQCLRRGVLLASERHRPLDAAEQAEVDGLRDALLARLKHPAGLEQEIVYDFVSETILAAGRLNEVAELAKSVKELLRRYRPKRLIVDGVRCDRLRIYAEMAHHLGIAVDYIWHSPHTPRTRKFDALGGDPRFTPVVDRVLSWGRVNDRWLDNVGSTQPRVTVGSPKNDYYLASREQPPARQDNVLLLQYTHNSADLRAVSHNMYSHFIGCYRTLKQLGYSHIRLKLHPQPDKWKKSYFEKISQHFGLDCPILKRHPYHELTEWADIVVGPLVSGAFFETLASGKKYVAFLLAPHAMDPDYYRGYPILAAIDQLPAALASPTRAAGERLLDDVCSIATVPCSSKRIWEVLERDLGRPDLAAPAGGTVGRTASTPLESTGAN